MADYSRVAPCPSAAKSSPQAYARPRDTSYDSQPSAVPREDDDWAGVDGNELIFALDKDDEETTHSPEIFAPCDEPRQKEVHRVGPALPSPPKPSFLPPLPISSVSSFPSKKSTGLVNPQGSKPLISLVKSFSTEIEPRDGSSRKPQPLLTLVKSISTEISRLEPEVTQSKSDSKLNAHLWWQITQPKGKNGDSQTAPTSPNISPSESKGSFFKAQEAKFEDTKRRFSEAMQEPLSRLSKIMGEENNGAPKHKVPLPGHHLPESALSQSGDSTVMETKMEGHGCKPAQHGAAPSDPVQGSQVEEYLPFEQKWGPCEIYSYGDGIQMVEVAQDKTGGMEKALPRQPTHGHHSSKSYRSVPCKTLGCIAVLAFNYFVLPLPPYVSGLCLGLAGGFTLGFLLILLMVTKHSLSPRKTQPPRETLSCQTPNLRDPIMLKVSDALARSIV